MVIGSKPWEAKIYSNKVEVAEIKKGEGPTFNLISNDGRIWSITNKVHGEVRPFSINVQQEKNKNKENLNDEALIIRENLFKHKGKFYMFANHPEGKPWHEYLSGPRYISRLDNFPFPDLEKIDNHIKHRLKRFRGVKVGETTGLGINGHFVKVERDLEDIGLLVAACSYLLYSTV
jgi:hypothetical protein